MFQNHIVLYISRLLFLLFYYFKGPRTEETKIFPCQLTNRKVENPQTCKANTAWCICGTRHTKTNSD